MIVPITSNKLAEVAVFIRDKLKGSTFTSNEKLYGCLFFFVAALVDNGVIEDVGHESLRMMYDLVKEAMKGEEKPS